MQILYDSDNPRAAELYECLKAPLSSEDTGPETFLVLGGDGFMLRSLRERYHPGAVFLGLNCGSVGFLLNAVPEDLPELVGKIRAKSFSIRKFPRIAMEVADQEGRTHRATAVNDIYLERTEGQCCHLRLVVDGIPVVERLVCDGIITSTALGSTAYNFSASGPVCHPSLRVLCVTPICPHSPRLRSVVLPLSSTISIEVLDPARRKAQALADGITFENITALTVTQSQEEVQLAFFDGHDYTAEMIHKVLTV